MASDGRSKRPRDLINMDERRAIVDELARTVTPSPSSISSSELEVAINNRCDKCRKPGGDIANLWSAVTPIRRMSWMLVGALLLLSSLLAYTFPHINSKLDAIDEMAGDMKVLKMQVQLLIDRRLRVSNDESKWPIANLGNSP